MLEPHLRTGTAHLCSLHVTAPKPLGTTCYSPHTVSLLCDLVMPSTPQLTRTSRAGTRVTSSREPSQSSVVCARARTQMHTRTRTHTLNSSLLQDLVTPHLAPHTAVTACTSICRLCPPWVKNVAIFISKSLVPAHHTVSTWPVFAGCVNAFYLLYILKNHRFCRQTLTGCLACLPQQCIHADL